MNQKDLGNFGETKALLYYKSLGYRMVDRNHANRYGEIDLIVSKGMELVFVEVKTVLISRGYEPVDQMTVKKLVHLQNAINNYLSLKRMSSKITYRLDFVGIIVDSDMRIIKFDHRPSVGLPR